MAGHRFIAENPGKTPYYITSKETSTEGNWEYNYQDWLYIFGVSWHLF